MNRTEKAKEIYLKNKNCSQAVFSAFAEKYGLPEAIAQKIASGFSGGMRNAEICGAVTGAVMVISLCDGYCGEDGDEVKMKCYEKTKEFTDKFKKKNQSIICRDLLGCDIFVGDNMQRSAEKNLFQTTCVKMVCDAAEILEEMGY